MPKGLWACAGAPPASPTRTSMAMQSSRVGIGHLAARCDAPGPDRVVVVEMIVAAHSDQFGQRRLDIPRFIDGAALDHGGLAVPVPGQPEPGQRPRQHRLLQLRLLPALAVVDGDICLLYTSDAADDLLCVDLG